MAFAVIRPLIFLSLYLGSLRATGITPFWQGDHTVMPFFFFLPFAIVSSLVPCYAVMEEVKY